MFLTFLFVHLSVLELTRHKHKHTTATRLHAFFVFPASLFIISSFHIILFSFLFLHPSSCQCHPIFLSLSFRFLFPLFLSLFAHFILLFSFTLPPSLFLDIHVLHLIFPYLVLFFSLCASSLPVNPLIFFILLFCSHFFYLFLPVHLFLFLMSSLFSPFHVLVQPNLDGSHFSSGPHWCF